MTSACTGFRSACFFGIYNLVRRHSTLGTTPAVAAGVEQERWGLEDVVEMTERYWKPRLEAADFAKAAARRAAEDDVFTKVLADEYNFHN